MNRWFFILNDNGWDFDQLLETIDDLDNNVIGRELILSIPFRLQSDYSTTEPSKVYRIHRDFSECIRRYIGAESRFVYQNKQYDEPFKKFKSTIQKYMFERV